MHESFQNLLVRLRCGDQAAAASVFHEFASRLVGLARTRLGDRFRQKVDPEDVVQSVYKSFFWRVADGPFELQDSSSLWTLLTVITLHKCGHQVEYYQAACRDVQREQRPAVCDAESSLRSFEAIAREPQPSEAAALTETLEQVMQQLDEREQQILTLRLQGYSTVEIAPLVQRTDRTVRLVLERVRKLLEPQRDA
jgi:RNA polymerase sigma-70 factor (ECF subfamily)